MLLPVELKLSFKTELNFGRIAIAYGSVKKIIQ